MTDNTTETIPYHSLVIATGASTSSPLFGLNQSDSNELKKHWTSFRDALLQAKSIVIAGGGPTGVETASELGEHLNGAPGWFCRSTPKVSITLVASTPEILPILRPTIGRKAEDLLRKVGVKVVKGVRVADIKPLQTLEKLCSPTTVTLDDGRTLEADIYIPATGFTPNTNFIPESLLAKDKRVEVNMSTLRVDKAGERVYALGDVAGSFRPSVPNIAAGVPVLCANMKRDLLHAAGEEPAGEDLIFKEDRRETQLVPIGKSSGVGAVYGWQVPGWFVWMVKGKDYFLGMLEAYWTGKQFAKEL
jgi:NADH dehydrogenase FAD-containing subunit